MQSCAQLRHPERYARGKITIAGQTSSDQCSKALLHDTAKHCDPMHGQVTMLLCTCTPQNGGLRSPVLRQYNTSVAIDRREAGGRASAAVISPTERFAAPSIRSIDWHKAVGLHIGSRLIMLLQAGVLPANSACWRAIQNRHHNKHTCGCMLITIERRVAPVARNKYILCTAAPCAPRGTCTQLDH